MSPTTDNNRKTYSLGLAGYPIAHSLSPALHAAALRACNLSGEYALYAIMEEGALAALLARVRGGEIEGVNVTIPHKEAVIPFLDDLTPTARVIGAVNVVYRKGEGLVGDNTDAPGFWAALTNFAAAHSWVFPKDRRALLLGAGGAARAVVYALAQHGWDIHLIVRRPSQARQLIEEYKRFFSAVQFSTSTFALAHPPDCDLLVNATPVGAAADAASSPWPGHWQFPPRAIVYDLVYAPLVTVLVRQARSKGLLAQTGLGMLVEQAALAFECWTGEKPPRAAMREAVIGERGLK